MCLELIKDYPEEMDDMIACYCIGWALTKEGRGRISSACACIWRNRYGRGCMLQLRGGGNYRFVLYSGGQLVI